MSLFKYFENDLLTFTVNNNNFITIMGKGNKDIVDNLLNLKRKNTIFVNNTEISKKNYNFYRSTVGFIINANLSTFTSETVEDELAYGMENLGVSKSSMHSKIEKYTYLFELDSFLKKDPLSLGVSKRCVIKIVSSLLLEYKIIILDNVLCELDKMDKEKIIKLLVDYVKEGNAVINFSNEVEDTLYGNYVVLTDISKVIASGKTLQILNEEKLMNKLGFSLPFIVDLNKQLMYYGLLDKYVIDERELVNTIWK
jgi:energy-coupling factor transport system ATP-binding protein